MEPARPFSRHRWDDLSVSKRILIALVAAFIVQYGLEAGYPRLGVERLFSLSRDGLAHGYVWQVVTYMFLHGSLMHLLVNCLGFFFAGREVEAICGPRHFLRIFFLGGIIGGLVQLAVGPANIELVGASGGVCAVLLAFTTLAPDREIAALLFFVIPVRMKAKWLGRAVILLSLGFAIFGGQGNIGHMAHLGGAVVGWAYVRRLGYGLPLRVWRRGPRKPSPHYVSSEIDAILDKIALEGIHSLTPEERRALERGREALARRVDEPRR